MDLDTVDVIEQTILRYNQSYRKGCPEISDAFYDTILEDYHRKVGDGRYEEFRKTLFADPGEVKHPHIMGSLEKVKNDDSENSLGDWVVGHIFPNDTGMLFVSAKVDGCSLRLEYKDGKLVDAVTRGDGLTGVSIFEKAKQFVPTELPESYTGSIRGECTLTHETFDDLKNVTEKEYKNLRNATVGIVNKKDVDINLCRYLRVIAYHVMDSARPMTKDEQFGILKKWGFQTPLHTKLVFDRDPQKHHEFCTELDEAMMKFFNEFASVAEYDMDGLVINDENETDFFTGGKIPENMIAFKPNQLIAHTKILAVEWQISKSGYFTPVAVLDPVELGGATVGRATLNNRKFVEDNGIKAGMEIDILKSGDIIPKVVKVYGDTGDANIDTIWIHDCPFCGSKLVPEGVELRCPNQECSQQHLIKAAKFLKELGVKNFDVAVLASLHIRKIDDLLLYVTDGSVRSNQLVSAINKHVFGANQLNLLAAFDWNGIALKTLTKMANFYSWEAMINPDGADFTKYPEGVGKATVDLYLKQWGENIATFMKIVNDQRFHGTQFVYEEKKTDGKLSGLAFCVTGELNTMSRDEFGKKILENGGLLKDSVTKKVTHLVTNTPNSNTSKNKKARQLGISVIDENQFLSLLGEGRDDLEAL